LNKPPKLQRLGQFLEEGFGSFIRVKVRRRGKRMKKKKKRRKKKK
jgi:hypothetical protein